MANLSKTTRDHEEIRRWAEERGGKPAHVKSTGSAEDIGILRIDFPGYSGGGSLESISWEEFFDKFDERGLALVYQEETAGGQKSNFNKLVNASAAGGGRQGRSRSTGSSSRASKTSKSAAKTARKRGASKKAVGSTSARSGAASKGGKSASSRKASPTSVRKGAAKKSSSRGAGGNRTSSKKRSQSRRATKTGAARRRR